MKQSKKSQEMKVYGKRAALTLFEKRPQDIIRAYVTQDGLFEFKKIVRHCADHKLAYHVVSSEELDNVTKATHHEGIALIVKKKEPPTLKALLSQKGRGLVLALEKVENPHNLGAILRSAAHFGVTGVLYEAKVPVAQTAAAYRTAEGGAESCPAVQVLDWGEVMNLAKTLKYQVFTTSSHQGESLFKTVFPEKSLVFMGAEGEGLSERLLKVGQGLLVPGTGEVESLNVSNAATAVLCEWFRQGLK